MGENFSLSTCSGLLKSSFSKNFHSDSDTCDVSPLVCLEHDIKKLSWQNLLFERVVDG